MPQDRDYILHMLLGIMRIEALVYAEIIPHALPARIMALLNESARAFQLISIGEAASNVRKDFRDLQPWRAIINTRNRLAHYPWYVNKAFMDRLTTQHLPVLKKQLIDMLR